MDQLATLDHRDFKDVHEFKLRDELEEWQIRKNWKIFKIQSMCDWAHNQIYKMKARRVTVNISSFG